jgi:hypothetical protein
MEVRMKFRWLPITAAALALSLGGTASAKDHKRVEVRVVTVAPPAPRIVATHEASPSTDYVWTDGYWDYTTAGWTWVDGRWVRPPEVGVTWVRPEYIQIEKGYRYVPGHWSSDEIYDEHGQRYVKEKRDRDRDHDRDRDRDHDHDKDRN